jgi:hypothetical protein
MKMTEKPNYITVKRFAEFTNLDPKVIRRNLHKFRAVKIGRCYIIELASIGEYFKEHNTFL